MLLYPKERQNTLIGTRLQTAKLTHNQGQNATTPDQWSNWQTQRCKILQQIGPNLGIQQYMDKRRQWMKSSLFDKQRTIWTKSDVLWTIQLSRNISAHNDKYIPRTITWRNPSKLHGWLHNPSRNRERTRKTHHQISQNSRETQSVFQTVKMWLQCHRNTHTCKGIALSPPLNCIAILRSSLSLFKYY